MKKILSIVALLLASIVLLFVSCDKETPPDADITDPIPPTLVPATWIVTFHPNNGEANTTQEVTDGEMVIQPTAPTRKDYGFAGWYREETLETPWNFTSDIVLANIDIYAKWDDQRPSVVFDSCGGTDVSPVRYETGASVEAPDAPIKNGYAFDGWYTADGKAWDFDATVSEGLTLMAHWRELDLTVTDETSLDLATGSYVGVHYDGNWIDGMNDVSDLSEISMQFTYTATVPGDYGLYMAAAKEWNDAKHAYFCVEVNGVALEDHLIMAPTGSWSDALNSNVIRVPFCVGENTVRITVDTTLVEDKLDAVEKIKGVYVLNVYPHYFYLPNENSGATLYREDITTEAPYTDNAYLLTDATKTLAFRMNVKESGNYDLILYAARPTSAGTMPLWVSLNGADTYETLWISQLADQDSRENTFRRQTAVSVYLPAGENTLTLCIPEDAKIDETAFLKVMYAIVAKSENQGEKVLVTFDSANGQTMRSASVTKGNSLVPPVQPVSETGPFAGWYLGEEEWNFADPVTSAMTLTAHYKTHHTVTFNGTPQVESISVQHGAKVNEDELKYTDNPGYKLSFWTDEEMSVPFDFETAIKADTTIYVSWVEIESAPATWIVTFHPNNGEANTTQEVTDGEMVIQPTAPTRKDYGFAGWYREETLETPWNFTSDIVLANIDIYAKWDDQRPSVVFDSCGGTDVSPVRYETGASVEAPDAPIKNGYAFDGWYTADGKAWDFDATVSEGLTLMAHWRELDLTVTDETSLDLATGSYVGVHYDGNWIDGMNDVSDLSEISMQFTYTATVPGDYGLYMAAAKEWNDAKHAYFCVEVNGVALEDHLIMAPTGSWSDALNSNVIRVPFCVGENTVRITVDTTLVEDKLDAVEKIKGVYVLNVYPHYFYLPNENSGATLYREDITTEAPYTDNAYLLTDATKTLAFRMNVKESGNYDLILYAARPTSAGTMPLWVSLNGADTYETLWISQLADQDSRENTFRRQTAVSVYLPAGENTLTLCIPEDAKIDETAFLKVMYAIVAKSENQGEKVLVTFDSANGQTMRSASVTKGNSLVPPVQPVSETGPFAGWYLGEEEWNFADPVTSAMTLTAHYKTHHTVTFNGTPQVESISVQHGAKVNEDELKYTDNPGYKLSFWTDEEMSVPFDFETAIKADTTIYVSWVEIESAPATVVTPLGISNGTFEAISWDGSKIDWGQANGSVTVHFTAETAGEYGIFLKYARDISWGSYQCAEYVITVNGTPVTEYLRIVPTDGWGTTVNTNAVRVTLQAGDNEIKISTRDNSDTSSYIAHIYEAYLTSPATDSVQLPTQIQAASGTLNDCNSQYGGKFVDFDRAGSYVEITLDVATEGDYDLSLLYAANMTAEKVVEIYLNGVDTAAGTITVAAGSSRDQYGYSGNATVHLNAGSNTIRIVLTEASEGNFDLSAIRISAQ